MLIRKIKFSIKMLNNVVLVINLDFVIILQRSCIQQPRSRLSVLRLVATTKKLLKLIFVLQLSIFTILNSMQLLTWKFLERLGSTFFSNEKNYLALLLGALKVANLRDCIFTVIVFNLIVMLLLASRSLCC